MLSWLSSLVSLLSYAFRKSTTYTICILTGIAMLNEIFTVKQCYIVLFYVLLACLYFLFWQKFVRNQDDTIIEINVDEKLVKG